MQISEFQAVNARRNYTPGWRLSQWGNALAGETGEACNIIKKIERGDTNHSSKQFQQALADECADVLAYLVLLANAAGFDLETAAISKFNRVSERVGSEVRI